jgi:Na+/H+-dicarboxylate symporter
VAAGLGMNASSTLTRRILLALIAGLAVGFLVRSLANTRPFLHDLLTRGLFELIGRWFVAALMMLVVPVVLVTLVNGIARMSEPARLGRIALQTMALYLGTTALAISLALLAATLVDPGEGRHFEIAPYTAPSPPSVKDVLAGLIPRNPLQAMAEGNMLQIIVFAIFLGLALALSRERAAGVAAWFEDMETVVLRLVGLVVALAPIGVFALMAKLGAELGLDAIRPLLAYFLTVLGVLLLQLFLVYPLLLALLAGLDPRPFLRKMRTPQLFAFSTASSAATIPVNLRTVEEVLGVDRRIAGFTVPLGATINMDGTAIMQGVAVVFIAQLYGMPFGIAEFLTVILMATLASIGTAGVPGVGLVMLAMVLAQLGLPAEAIGLIIGIDRLLDMVRTAVNISGDAMVSLVVARWNGALRRERYAERDPASSATPPAPS